MARVTVYQATKYNQNNDRMVILPFMGTLEALKFAALAPVDGSGIEVDERELDRNWFYHRSRKPVGVGSPS